LPEFARLKNTIGLEKLVGLYLFLYRCERSEQKFLDIHFWHLATRIFFARELRSLARKILADLKPFSSALAFPFLLNLINCQKLPD
jgi:hypothetical protein